MGKFVLCIMAVLGIIVLMVAGWFLERKFNDWAYYDNATQKVVCKMIKAEHLSEEGRKICGK